MVLDGTAWYNIYNTGWNREVKHDPVWYRVVKGVKGWYRLLNHGTRLYRVVQVVKSWCKVVQDGE